MSLVPSEGNPSLAACHQDPSASSRHLRVTHSGPIEDCGSSPPSAVMLGLGEQLAVSSTRLG